MKIKEVTYGESRRMPFDLKSKTYPWSKLAITAEIGFDDDPSEVIDQLKWDVRRQLDALPDTPLIKEVPGSEQSNANLFWAVRNLVVNHSHASFNTQILAFTKLMNDVRKGIR